MDKELLLSVLPREALIDICKRFKVRVDGFQKKLDRAQIGHLGTSVKTAITQSELRRKRKGGTTPVSLVEIVEYLYDKTKERFPYVESVSVEELILEVEQNPAISSYEGLVVFYKRFPALYEEKMEMLLENKKNNIFIFTGVCDITDVSTIEKINGVVYSSYESDAVLSVLNTLRNRIESREPGALEEATSKLNEGTEEEFFNLFRIMKKEFQQDINLAFLLKDDNYQKRKYVSLVLHAILDQSMYITDTSRNQAKILKVKNDELTFKLEEQDKLIKVLKAKEAKVEQEANKYLELKKVHELMKQTKRKEEKQKQSHDPFIQYFKELALEHNILIVTNEKQNFEGTPLSDFLYSAETLIMDKKSKSTAAIEGKHLFITRVSFKSTPIWLSLTKYLDKNNVTYTELSGYGISNYIVEITGCLNRKENIYDYYV